MAQENGDTPLDLDWCSASEARSLVKEHNGQGATFAIVNRANAGLVRTQALMFQQELPTGSGRKSCQTLHVCELPKKFWWATGHVGLEQDWNTGDFSTWIDQELLWKAFGVKFCRKDIVAMLATKDIASKEQPFVTENERRPGGRKPAAWWPKFAEELAVYIHEKGVPEGSGPSGQEEVIKSVSERMSENGADVPSRTTVQSVVRAVIKRIRSA